jgi:glycosyltransferase involved in cell wall biosynthesis
LPQSISIVIPAFNEESRLPDTLRKIEQYFVTSERPEHEIIVVDDGSTDGTVKAAEGFAAANANIRVLRNPGNRGKGYSVRHGMLEARLEWCLFSDADLSTPIAELDKLAAAARRDNVPVAIGSRALDRSLVGVHQSAFREMSGKFFNAVMQVTIGLPIKDTQCGFKLFRRDVAREAFSRQTLERWGFDVEVLFIARQLGHRIAEVPVRWDNAEGSKLSIWSGATAFLELAKVRVNSLRGLYK